MSQKRLKAPTSMALTDWNVINLKSYINEGAHSKNMKIGTNTK